MQNDIRQITVAAPFGRSSVVRLPARLREAVDAAIADGATIDEITARIRDGGGACSRSAVGRYAKNVRDLIRRQQEADRANAMWVRTLGGRAHGRTGLVLTEVLRTLLLTTLADLCQREEPVSVEELGRLALALGRIEGADRLRLQRERAAAEAAPRVRQAAGQATGGKGLSTEAVATVREAVVVRPRPPERAKAGATRAPGTLNSAPSSLVSPLATFESAPATLRARGTSCLVPLDPGEFRIKKVRRACLAPGHAQPEAWATPWTGYMGNSVQALFGLGAARPGRAKATEIFRPAADDPEVDAGETIDPVAAGGLGVDRQRMMTLAGQAGPAR